MKQFLLAIFIALPLPSCSNMSPEANALAVETAARLVDVGINRLNTKHPQK